MYFRTLNVYQYALRTIGEVAGLDMRGHSDVRDQLRRAALSIALNIAEATGKPRLQDQRRYFAIARGSAMECAAIVDVCRILKLATNEPLDVLDEHLLSIVRMLSRMILPRVDESTSR